MRILYLDCFSGISGDMTLASLVDLGADRDYIESELKKLNVGGYELAWHRVVKKGIASLKVDVIVDDEGHGHHHGGHKHGHDHGHHEHDHGHGHEHHHHHHHHEHDHGHHHDHEHDHGHHHHHEHDHEHHHHHEHDHEHHHHHEHDHGHHHDHEHDHGHHHDHEHDHEHHHHHGHDHGHGHHHHRGYADIVGIIEKAGLSTRATKLSLAIFEKIGAAESKIHNIPMDTVHFHEVGAVDSIVDIVGVALAIDNLNPDKIVCAPVPLGSGTVRIDHGIYPVPAPATLEMMRGLPVAPSPYSMELTTPTGAGIVSALVNEFSASLPPMIVEAIGYGAGTRELPNQPNVLRSVLGFAEKTIGVWPLAGVEQIRTHHHSENEQHHREQ